MRATVEEIRDTGADFGLSETEIESRYGPLHEVGASFTAAEFFRLLVVSAELAAQGSRLCSPGVLPGAAPRAATPALPRPSPRPVEPRPVSVGQVLSRTMSAGGGAAAAGVDLVDERATGRGRSPVGPAPRGRSYRATVNRRVAVGGSSPSAWWLRSGSHASDVSLWVARGWKSPDALERLIVQRFRSIVCDGRGNVELDAWREWFPVVALCFVLFYARTLTRRAGYSAAVVGSYRGQLAAQMAHRFRGVPVDPDTISRYLGRLRPVCTGLLDWHQPSPAEARRWGLPHSLHFCEGGRVQPQACNVYWWRKIAPSGAACPTAPLGSDLPSGYGQDSEKSQSKVSPGAPGIHPGGPDPPTIAPAGVKPRS